MLRSSAVALTAASLLLLTACGSTGSTGSTTTTAAKSGCAPSTAAAPAGIPALKGNPTDTSVQAVIPAGAGTPPTTLVTQDVITCSGPTATAQATVAVRYTGALYTDGTVFDASWRKGPAPVTFPLAQVVPGFSQGIVGMHPGDRRVIVIPPALGYKEEGKGPVPGDATLVFVVDLVTIS